MKLNKSKYLMGAAVLALGMFPIGANAVNPTVQVSLSTDSTITAADGVDADFGQWLIVIRSGETVTLTMDKTGTITTGGITDSLVQQIDNTGQQAATVTVDLPDGASNVILQMQHTAITDFTDAGLALTGITYSDTVADDADFTAAATDVDVKVVDGDTPETVTFGFEISVTATPANGTDTASFDVSFAY